MHDAKEIANDARLRRCGSRKAGPTLRPGIRTCCSTSTSVWAHSIYRSGAAGQSSSDRLTFPTQEHNSTTSLPQPGSFPSTQCNSSHWSHGACSLWRLEATQSATLICAQAVWASR